MRRRSVVLMMHVALFAGGALRAAAQMPLPPTISKPIDAVRQAAAKAPPPAAEARAQQQSVLQAQRDSVKKAQKAAGAVGLKGAVTFYRESYAYSSDARRDPFVSLMATGEMRPLLADLLLVGVIYDGAGRNSVASLIDATTNESYRVKVGNVLGRMKVVKIGLQEITLDIDEFGFSRQETLLIDHTRKAGATPGRRP